MQTGMEGKEKVAGFLGCGWKFPPTVDPVTGRMLLSSQEEDVAEAVKIILFTGKGERVMQPDFGCGIRRFAFSDMSAITMRSMEQEILDALIRWEPRIREVTAEIGRERIGEGILEIRVSYIVRSTNSPFNLVFPYYINEGTL